MNGTPLPGAHWLQVLLLLPPPLLPPPLLLLPPRDEGGIRSRCRGRQR
jgi:hypothetical protein